MMNHYSLIVDNMIAMTNYKGMLETLAASLIVKPKLDNETNSSEVTRVRAAYSLLNLSDTTLCQRQMSTNKALLTAMVQCYKYDCAQDNSVEEAKVILARTVINLAMSDTTNGQRLARHTGILSLLACAATPNTRQVTGAKEAVHKLLS